LLGAGEVRGQPGAARMRRRLRAAVSSPAQGVCRDRCGAVRRPDVAMLSRDGPGDHWTGL
jgi:hypothetical protein